MEEQNQQTRSRHSVRRTCLAAGLMFALSSAALAAPSISFEAQAVTASGITRGGQAAFMLLTSGASEQTQQRAWYFVVRQDPGSSGTVRLDLKEPLKAATLCAVVDVTSGEYSIASPPGYTASIVTFPPAALRKAPEGYGSLVLDRYAATALVVRPRKGAWYTMAVDGGGADDDHRADGRSALAAASMKPLSPNSATLHAIVPRDVVIVFDWHTMEVFATEVSQ